MGNVVVLRTPSGKFIQRVDPKTRECTGESQQFLREGDKLTILPKYKWVLQPHIIEVGEVRF